MGLSGRPKKGIRNYSNVEVLLGDVNVIVGFRKIAAGTRINAGIRGINVIPVVRVCFMSLGVFQ